MAAATLNNAEMDNSKQNSKIKDVFTKVKGSVLDSSEVLIKNVTGKEVAFDSNPRHQKLETDKRDNHVPSEALHAPSRSDPINANNATVVNLSHTTPNGKVTAVSERPSAPGRSGVIAVPSSSVDEEGPVDAEEAARRWEEELERLKREKKWEAELVRIKKEKEQAARSPPAPPPLSASDDHDNISTLTASPTIAPPAPVPGRSPAPVASTGCTCIVS